MGFRVPSPWRGIGPGLRGDRPRAPARPSRRALRLAALPALLGPGLIAANAGNDAGGIATYSQVGARFGYGLLWMMLLITFSLSLVHKLAARMGVVTGKGLADLVRENYGIRWSALATGALVVANLGICVSDFVGVGAALGLAGVPAWLSVPVAAAGIWLIIVRGSYRTAERVFIWLTIPFFAYPLAAVMAGPDWGAVARGFVPHLEGGSGYLVLFVATAGTTITPYMQLYLQSAVAERGLGEDDLPAEERQAVVGAVFADIVAAFVIIATAATLHAHGIDTVGSASDAAKALEPFAGRYAELLFGIGLVGASLLAAAILPIATSYAVSESVGAEKGLRQRSGAAPVFVRLISLMIALAAAVAVIPGVPVISLLIGVQVVNGVLLPISLFFIWRIARSEEIMGAHRNRAGLDALAAVTVLVTSALSVALLVVTLTGL